jgi:phosphate transport system permease protein
MTAPATITVPPVPPSRPNLPRVRKDRTWRVSDRLGLGFAWLLGLLFCAVAASIVLYLLFQGLRHLSPSMLVTRATVSTTTNYTGGLLDAEIGTGLCVLLAMTIAGPVGVGVAVWLSEFGRPAALARVVESVIEMLAGAPSVVLALFGLVIFEAPFLGFLSETTPSGVVYGKSFFAAAAILSLDALPLVVTTVREGLQQIPTHVREASYAVGKTKIATTRRVLLPAARPSVITGSMLGAGRVLGDTAIIILLLGGTLSLQGAGSVPLLSALQGTGSTLTYYIFYYAPTGDGNQAGKAYAAAFVLLVGVLVVNAGVDIFSRRARELRWS